MKSKNIPNEDIVQEYIEAKSRGDGDQYKEGFVEDADSDVNPSTKSYVKSLSNADLGNIDSIRELKTKIDSVHKKLYSSDINEDCIALVAMDLNGKIQDSVIVDYPSVKERRHEFFTQRKRMQEAGQTAFESVVQTEEKDYVHDQLHKVSREAVEWVSQYDTPLIVFEDLKDMRDDIDYGTV